MYAVAIQECFLGPAQHLARHIGHAWDGGVGQQVGVLGQRSRIAGQIATVIADALEIGVHLHGHDEHPEVGGYGRVQCQNALAMLIDGKLQRIHLAISYGHRFAHLCIPLNESIHGVGQLLVNERGHLDEITPQRCELAVELGPVSMRG